MIFVALGTCDPFPRLLTRIDRLAAELTEEVVVQYGQTELPAPHYRGFAYAPSLDEYYRQARLVICHAGLGIQTELLLLRKSFIAVPRLHRCREHFDDHQVETCEYLQMKFGVHFVLDVQDLTCDLLMHYDYVAPYTGEALDRFRRNVLPVIVPPGGPEEIK